MIASQLLLIYLSVFTSSTTVYASKSEATSRDIFLQTRVDRASVNWLIDRTRTILNQTDSTPFNTQSGDQLTGTVPVGTSELSLKDIASDPKFKAFEKTFTPLFKRDLKEAKIRFHIPRIAYSVKKITATPQSINVKDPSFKIETLAQISGINVDLIDGIRIELVVPEERAFFKKTKEQVFLNGSIDHPKIVIPDTLPPFQSALTLTANRSEEITFVVNGYDLKEAPKYVTAHQSKFIITAGSAQTPFGIEHIQVTPVVVRMNQQQREINLDTFKPIIQMKFNSLLAIVLTELGKSLETKIGPNIIKKIFASKVTTQIGVKNEKLHTKFSIVQFNQPAQDQIRLNAMGQHCTEELWEKYKEDCYRHEPSYKPARVISAQDHELAEDEITRTLLDKQYDLALSVGENYLNRLLKSTVDAKLWDKPLEENELELGDRGAFVILNQDTKNPELLMDVISRDRVYLRFPLRISTEVSFQAMPNPNPSPQDKPAPKISIRIKKILSTPDEIINGIPEYELPSRLIRFARRRIANIILRMASELEGSTVLELEIPELTGVGLEHSTLQVSKFGRLNLFFGTQSFQ